jgi:hypothetical protein
MKKVKEFKKLAQRKLEEAKIILATEQQTMLKRLSELELETFSNSNPYNGEAKNKIFLTYSDSYKYNSPLWQSVEKLHHPHLYYDDRGYIKGVVIDLSAYMVLRSAKNICYNLNLELFRPKLKNSLKKQDYLKLITETIINTNLELIEYKLELLQERNTLLKQRSNCSLLNYIESI